MKDRTLIQLRRGPFHSMDFELFYAQQNSAGAVAVAEPATLKLQAAHHEISQPLLTLDEEGIQQLMNDLWIAGIRPSKQLSEPQNIDRVNGEVNWLRGTVDHLLNKTYPREQGR